MGWISLEKFLILWKQITWYCEITWCIKKIKVYCGFIKFKLLPIYASKITVIVWNLWENEFHWRSQLKWIQPILKFKQKYWNWFQKHYAVQILTSIYWGRVG
jgi:hypothetical protein